MSKLREEFEAWYSKELGFREDNAERMFSMFCDDGETHEYYRLGVRNAWLAWQASRNILCVELPDLKGSIELGFIYSCGDIEEALDAAGIRYK